MVRKRSTQLTVKARPEYFFSFLAPRVHRGVEVAGPGFYRRTFSFDGENGVVSFQKSGESEITLSATCSEEAFAQAAARAKRLFDIDAPLKEAQEAFEGDSILGGFDVPPITRSFDLFEFIIRAILGQQILISLATAAASRLASVAGQAVELGDLELNLIYPSPQALFECLEADEMSLGISKAKITAIKGVCQAFIQDPDCFTLPLKESWAVFSGRLLAIKGIGPWTASYVGVRGVGESDCFPAEDLGLRKAVSPSLDNLLTLKEVRQLCQRWSPYRSYAAMTLWAGVLEVESKR